jgi:hypothetical protein
MKKTKPSGPFPLPLAYRRLCRQLGQIGWIALGSLVERTLPGQGGPRYQWSRRVTGKTVSVALSAEQFAWLKTAIGNQRHLEKLLSQMQKMTLDYMWKRLPSTTRRKKLSKKTLGLN